MCYTSMQNEPLSPELDQSPAFKSVGQLIAALAQDPAYSFPDFTGTLDQLKGDKIEALATDTRYDLEVETAMMGEYPPCASKIARIPCRVDPNPARGSYNLIFFIDFDDGESWVLKASANGHPRCWDEFAAGALESEAFTMRWIKEKTTMPVPEIYGFDSSMDNAIGCPYIMMEYIKGVSLYEGWFNRRASPARLEQFRARALQTIAAAMVQLNNFRFHTSGSLRFSSDGKPYGFQSAKVVDFVGTAARPQDDPCKDVLFVKKGPFKDPMDFLLFNLIRRDASYRDTARVRGLFESLRLFTQWTLEPISGDPFPFVLGHPDFDLQNILVKEDGTLCGILDWDGVGAVPHTVGCLRYPLWLTRDWEPSNYHYDAATGGRKLKSELWENSPNENQCYRAMYAQFIEAELSHQGMDKSSTKITRLSLLAGVLESTDTIPEFLYGTIQNLYGKIEEAAGDEPYELDGGFGSSEKVSDSEEEEEWQEAAEVQAEDGTDPTELGSAFTGRAEEARLQVDCKKCRAAQTLEFSKIEDGPHELNSNCSPLHTKGIPQYPSIRGEIVPTLDGGDVKGGNSERTMQAFDRLRGRGTNLLSWMAQKLREAAEALYVSTDDHARIKRRSCETSQRDLAHAKARNDSNMEPTPMTFESKLDHSKDCSRNKKPIRPSTPENQDDSVIASSGDVWARIGRTVQKWGVPSAMIEDREADIAELVVQKMKEEQNRSEISQKNDALRATNPVYETERYNHFTAAGSSGYQTNETITRKLKETLGIGPTLGKAHSIREFKPVDMELARLDPAIIAAKKSDDQKPVVHRMSSNTPSVGAEQLDKPTASRKPQGLAVPERDDEMRSRLAEISKIENHTAQAEQKRFAHSKGLPQISGQGRATKGSQIEGGNAFPMDRSRSCELRRNHKRCCWEGNKPRNAPVSRSETQASSTSSGQRGIGDCGMNSSRPQKDEHGDEALFIMDDLQGTNEDKPSWGEIDYDYERSFTKDDNNALSSDEEYGFVDNGGFSTNDICVGLEEDTLDEERFDRLRTGFVHVLESTLGLI